MNAPRVPPRFVPTLTEVVEFEEAQVLDEPVVLPAEPMALQAEPVAPEPAFSPALAPAVEPVPAPILVSAPAGVPLDVSVADVLGEGQLEVLPVPEAQVVAHPEAFVAASATEDVPAFLLATQPVPMWSPPAATEPAEPAVAEPEPVEQVLSAIVSKPMVAAEPATSSNALDAEREEQIVQSVLTELQRRSDLMLEYRLRETLTPILARLCDALIKEAREDLAATLRDVVSRAVAQELTRHRPK